MSTPVKVTITISPCCLRLKYLTDILTQARNLNLNETYVVAVENLILDLMPLINANDGQGIVSLYESNLTNILSLRDTAFNEWKEEVKNQFEPIPLPIVEP